MKAALLNDRLSWIADQIGFAGITNLLKQIRAAGCTHVGLNQHDDGGFWEGKYINLMADTLYHAKFEGLKVIYFADDISKAARKNPAGWPITLGRHVPQLGGRTFTSDSKHRVFVKFNARAGHLYTVHYKATAEVEPFFFRNTDPVVDWQISKYGRNTEGRFECIAIDGDGQYTLVFRANEPFELKILNLRAVEDATTAMGSVEVFDDSCIIYHGTEGPSGHFHCQTPDFGYHEIRLTELTNSYRLFVQRYGPYIFDGTIDHIFIGGDEFTACGAAYTWSEMLAEIDRHNTACQALGLNCLLWARPADYKHPSRGNLRCSLDHALGDLNQRSLNHRLTPILWQEQTTPELCAGDRFELDGIAGVYLTLSNPQHFVSAGHKNFAAHWWPRDGKTWADYPIDALRECCETIK